MSVCATCREPGIRDYTQHQCPGLGPITLTRRFGCGFTIQTAPHLARIALDILTDPTWPATMHGPDQINIADQMLYQVTGYDPETASLLLELVEDWRQTQSNEEQPDA